MYNCRWPILAETGAIVNQSRRKKDVDGLGLHAVFDSATALAIQWLLAGYNVDLNGKQVLLIGRGRLVGAPLERLLKASGIDVQVADSKTKDLAAAALAADVIVTATGQPGILTSGMIKQGATVVDAGTASENGKTVGDVAPGEVYERDDLTITPPKGGVGPLTVGGTVRKRASCRPKSRRSRLRFRAATYSSGNSARSSAGMLSPLAARKS